MAKILVTGAAGLLGTEICKQLKQDPSNEVVAVDNLSRSSVEPPCHHFWNVDLSDKNGLSTLPWNDFDQIYHYSAINGTSNFYERPNAVLTNNFISDVHVFEFAAKCPNLTKLVYASTSEIVSDEPVYPVPELTDITIKDIHNARWSYRIAKIASENYLMNSRLPFVILRYFNIYGSGSKKGHFIADQMDRIDRKIFKVTGGEETRSFCYIEDAIAATIYCANSDQATGQVVNIGNDTETKILDAANTVASAMGHDNPKWEILPGAKGSTQRRLPDISKLRSIMPHYAPRQFDEGMSKIVAQRIKNES